MDEKKALVLDEKKALVLTQEQGAIAVKVAAPLLIQVQKDVPRVMRSVYPSAGIVDTEIATNVTEKFLLDQDSLKLFNGIQVPPAERTTYRKSIVQFEGLTDDSVKPKAISTGTLKPWWDVVPEQLQLQQGNTDTKRIEQMLSHLQLQLTKEQKRIEAPPNPLLLQAPNLPGLLQSPTQRGLLRPPDYPMDLSESKRVSGLFKQEYLEEEEEEETTYPAVLKEIALRLITEEDAYQLLTNYEASNLMSLPKLTEEQNQLREKILDIETTQLASFKQRVSTRAWEKQHSRLLQELRELV